MKRYLVLTYRNPGFDPAVIEPHYAFLDGLRARRQLEMAGPFTDKSGGAYIVLADDLDAATAIAHADPVHATGASRLTVHEWDAT